jgi:beta-N-acetylhexosaminidase
MLNSLTSLPLEQQIGQFFYIGLPGTELDEETRSLVEHVTPGGVIIFGRNVATPDQLRSLLYGVRDLLPVEPLCGIDQEGGLVDRLRRICTPMPSARTIRQHGDLAAARSLGRITGEVLRLLGFNMNFAPVMSIMTDERDLLSNGLFSRSFGRSPGEVLGYTMVYLRGLQGTGCLGCLKHFQREDDRVRAVMVSHGGFPNVDIRKGVASGRLEPASVSYAISTKLLRHELGYKHLVVTDDLEMGAIARLYEIEDAVLRAFEAGQDMFLICSRPDTIRRGYNALLRAARDGLIKQERINHSLGKIADFKALMQPPLPFDAARFKQLSDEIVVLNRKLNYTYGENI